MHDGDSPCEVLKVLKLRKNWCVGGIRILPYSWTSNNIQYPVLESVNVRCHVLYLTLEAFALTIKILALQVST